MAIGGEPGIRVTRVLIVSDEQREVDEVNLLLSQSYYPIEVVGSSDARQFLQRIRDFVPDVVLVYEGGRIPATDVCRQVYQQYPSVCCLILVPGGRQEDAAYLRQALRAGARDVVQSPPVLDSLVSSITIACRTEEERRDRRLMRGRSEVRGVGGKLVTFYSPKGGVGKSFLAANLAVVLARSLPQSKTILVDLDLQFGDQHVLLDLEKTRTILDLLTISDEMNSESVANVVVNHSSGLPVLLAPPIAAQADLVDEESVRKILITFKQFYDFIVVDTSSAMNEPTLTALELADQILVVATPDVLSIRGTRTALELLGELGVPKDVVSIVVNRLQKKSEIKTGDIQRLFDYEVIEAIPEDFLGLQSYLNAGIPLADARHAPAILKNIQSIAARIAAATMA